MIRKNKKAATNPLGRFIGAGKHTMPRIVERGAQKQVFKRLSVGKGLSLNEAKTLAAAMNKYRIKLMTAGVSVSKILAAHPIKDSNGKYFVGSLEEFIGEETAQSRLMNAKPKTAMHAFRELLNQVYTAVKGNTTQVRVLIDPKPSNFVFDSSGRLIYVDFYTPKLATITGKLTPFVKKLHSKDRETLTQRYGNKQAVIHLLVAYAISTRPRLRRQLIAETLDFLNEHNDKALARDLSLALRKTTSPQIVLSFNYSSRTK